MKVSVIHNLFRRNPYVNDSVILNLIALRNAHVEFEYILFNDHGDIEIKEDVKEYTDLPNIKYIYSNINYGNRMCSGGWVGALTYITGDLIHNIGQDDVFSSLFYEIFRSRT